MSWLWISPRLGIQFVWQPRTELVLYRPDRKRFLSSIELAQRAEQESLRAEQAEQARLNAIPRLLNLGLSLEQIAEALGLTVEEVESIVQQ
jgi:predicted transposase/invertase (TIGR01784 family)